MQDRCCWPLPDSCGKVDGVSRLAGVVGKRAGGGAVVQKARSTGQDAPWALLTGFGEGGDAQRRHRVKAVGETAGVPLLLLWRETDGKFAGFRPHGVSVTRTEDGNTNVLLVVMRIC